MFCSLPRVNTKYSLYSDSSVRFLKIIQPGTEKEILACIQTPVVMSETFTEESRGSEE